MNCVEAIDVMEDAIEGRLPPELRGSFEGHLAECGPCGTYFQQLGITRAALHGMRKPGGTSPIRDKLIDAFRDQQDREPDSK